MAPSKLPCPNRCLDSLFLLGKYFGAIAAMIGYAILSGIALVIFRLLESAGVESGGSLCALADVLP